MKDLFEHQDELPQEVQDIIIKFSDSENNYNDCKTLVEELERVGYTCYYGLDASPFGLKKRKLPKSVEKYLEKNSLLSVFGLVSISCVKAITGTILKKEDLKARIQARFGHEMQNGIVEFTK